ncbi:hypothetical protein NGTWS0302_19730 [Mycolicibacterium cyprinidarum]|uniref:Uncharacterized protein n=1 Tax=Mycolicibacterium cyprinidarum TaxID=2860311 RepID=A0ABQ4V7W2_9MYCO|nr:hypothetical protein NGTWS1702_09990 [Mycolicibacterium sp. NGTWSNA01]GJF20400.1 hypothetical protein NGTWS0302_19730 [Mycolicibacterium sp. NGTWS0302]
MESTVTAVAVVIALAAWHRHNRRHPGWLASVDGRFDILCGYALALVAVYWLVSAPSTTGWEWALGGAWGLAAMMAFVCGFGVLNGVTAQHARLSQAMESIDPLAGAVPRRG